MVAPAVDEANFLGNARRTAGGGEGAAPFAVAGAAEEPPPPPFLPPPPLPLTMNKGRKRKRTTKEKISRIDSIMEENWFDIDVALFNAKKRVLGHRKNNRLKRTKVKNPA